MGREARAKAAASGWCMCTLERKRCMFFRSASRLRPYFLSPGPLPSSEVVCLVFAAPELGSAALGKPRSCVTVLRLGGPGLRSDSAPPLRPTNSSHLPTFGAAAAVRRQRKHQLFSKNAASEKSSPGMGPWDLLPRGSRGSARVPGEASPSPSMLEWNSSSENWGDC